MIGLVIFLNLQCAVEFFTNPGRYASGFELTGIPGNAAIQGFGVLFMMWNIPYLFAIFHPIKYRPSLIQAIIMQTVGLFGETWIYLQTGVEYATLRNSIFRFIVFDFIGLTLLILAIFLVEKFDQKS